MHLKRPRRRFGTELNITPLIDIVFLLIIFSMVVSQFKKVEVEKLRLPEAARGDDRTDAAMSRVVVSISEDGRVVVAGRAYTPESLAAFLAKRAEEQTEPVQVLIRGDRDARWDAAARVMQVCAARGISHLKVAVLKPGESDDAP